MKKITRHSLFLSAGMTILLSICLFFLQQFSLLTLSNSLTMVSLLCLMIGLILLLSTSGNFDFFIYSFKRLQNKKRFPFQPRATHSQTLTYYTWLMIMSAAESFLLSVILYLLT